MTRDATRREVPSGAYEVTDNTQLQEETGVWNKVEELLKRADELNFFKGVQLASLIKDLNATNEALESLKKAGTRLEEFRDQCSEFMKVAQDMSDNGNVCHEKLNNVKPTLSSLEGIEKLFDSCSKHVPSLCEKVKGWAAPFKQWFGLTQNSKPSNEELKKQIDELKAATENLRGTSAEIEEGLQSIRDSSATLSLRISICIVLFDSVRLGVVINQLAEFDTKIPRVKEKREEIQSDLQVQVNDLNAASQTLDRALASGGISLDPRNSLQVERFINQKQRVLQNLISRCRDLVQELKCMEKGCSDSRSDGFNSIFNHTQQFVRLWFTGANATSMLSRNSVAMMGVHGLFIGLNAAVIHKASSKLEEVCKELDACMILQESIQQHRLQLESVSNRIIQPPVAFADIFRTA